MFHGEGLGPDVGNVHLSPEHILRESTGHLDAMIIFICAAKNNGISINCRKSEVSGTDWTEILERVMDEQRILDISCEA